MADQKEGETDSCWHMDRFVAFVFPIDYRLAILCWGKDSTSIWVSPLIVNLSHVLHVLIFFRCWAQFMENPLFNTILVILYYWVTLVVISVLYTFIYRKAWEMERRRKAEHKV